jgi:hypothetical protein
VNREPRLGSCGSIRANRIRTGKSSDRIRGNRIRRLPCSETERSHPGMKSWVFVIDSAESIRKSWVFATDSAESIWKTWVFGSLQRRRALRLVIWRTPQAWLRVHRCGCGYTIPPSPEAASCRRGGLGRGSQPEATGWPPGRVLQVIGIGLKPAAIDKPFGGLPFWDRWAITRGEHARPRDGGSCSEIGCTSYGLYTWLVNFPGRDSRAGG